MTTPLTLHIPDDLAQRLTEAAAATFRTPDQHALWILHRALPERSTRRTGRHAHLRVPFTPLAEPLKDAMRGLLRSAGDPSSRHIAALIAAAGGDRVAHNTINEALRWDVVPTWRVTAAIIRALGGNPRAYRSAWEQAHAAGMAVLNGDSQKAGAQ